MLNQSWLVPAGLRLLLQYTMREEGKERSCSQVC